MASSSFVAFATSQKRLQISLIQFADISISDKIEWCLFGRRAIVAVVPEKQLDTQNAFKI